MKTNNECSKLAEQARLLISETIPIEETDEFSVMFRYRGFYMQIVFSNIYPIIVFNLARSLNHVPGINDSRIISVMNLNDLLGSHFINAETNLYLYRTIHHLDTGLSKERLLEILEYSTGEACQAYSQLAGLEAHK